MPRARAHPDRGEPRDRARAGRRTAAWSPRAGAHASRSTASSRARRSRTSCCTRTPAHSARRSPTSVGGRRETLVYLSAPGELAAYEELRAGFTAAVSHELRTPLARLLVLLETRRAPRRGPGRPDRPQARAEVVRIGELIDDVLFLSELESGRAVVALGSIRALPVLDRGRRRGAPSARSSAPASRCGSTARRRFELPLRAADARRSSSRTWSRTRSATRATGATCSITCGESRRRAAPGRRRQRRRRRRGGAAPAVRALLPRRPRPLDDRHGPRARDRQAHRRRRRRDGRGDRALPAAG